MGWSLFKSCRDSAAYIRNPRREKYECGSGYDQVSDLALVFPPDLYDFMYDRRVSFEAFRLSFVLRSCH